VADEPARAAEAADVADRRQEGRRRDHVDPGTVISRLASAESSAWPAITPFDVGDLGSEEVDLAQGAVDRLALLVGQLELFEPAPALPAEQVGGFRLRDQAADQRGVDLVLSGAPPSRSAETRSPTGRSPSGGQFHAATSSTLVPDAISVVRVPARGRL
jgi:hypothetical protein